MKLKKLISLMLAGAMVLSVTACGGSGGFFRQRCGCGFRHGECGCRRRG